MQNNNHNNNNGNFNNSFPKQVAQNNGQWQNNNQLNQNPPHHRNYVERVVDYKFIPVMPMNMNQPTYNNSQPFAVQQPNPYYQQPQQPLLQQFIVPPSSPVGSDFNNYQFQPSFFEPPFSSMPFDNFYPNVNMLNPMDFGFNNNQNNFMPNLPNSAVNNQPDFNNYNVNNNEQMYNNNQGNYNQQPLNVNQMQSQQQPINNQLNEQIEKYEQQISNLNTKYNQLNNSHDSEVFDEKLTNLEDKIVKLKNKLSEVDLFEDEIADDNIKIFHATKKTNHLEDNQLKDTALVSPKEIKNQKIKKALIITVLFVLFIGIAIGAYFGYTLWLKDILINKLKWTWLK